MSHSEMLRAKNDVVIEQHIAGPCLDQNALQMRHRCYTFFHVGHVTCLPQLAPLNPHALRHQCRPLRKLGTVVLARPVVGVA